MLELTSKQKEFWKGATHRWNIKSGATRSGKTYLDYYMIPKRIRAVTGKNGLIILLGNTRGTLQRNIIDPLQNIWGTELVSSIRSDNTATLFGEKVYCLGADKINSVDKIRGSSIKYCYGDEVVTWHEDVFNMLKSRLDKEYSIFDGTCNPDNPNHWFKQFIDSAEEKGIDLFYQKYTLDDNTFLDKSVAENMKREYAGTIFYDRNILGEWVPAEGLIYRLLADNPQRYMIDEKDLPRLLRVTVGEDFGGNKSGHAIVSSGIGTDGVLYFTSALFRKAKGSTADELINWSIHSFDGIFADTGQYFDIYADSAEQVLINSIRERTRFSVYNSLKRPIVDRIRTLNILLATDRVKFVRGKTETLTDALAQATWDDKKMEDTRLDNGSYNNDIIDAAEYSFEYYINDLRG